MANATNSSSPFVIVTTLASGVAFQRHGPNQRRSAEPRRLEHRWTKPLDGLRALHVSNLLADEMWARCYQVLFIEPLRTVPSIRNSQAALKVERSTTIGRVSAKATVSHLIGAGTHAVDAAHRRGEARLDVLGNRAHHGHAW